MKQEREPSKSTPSEALAAYQNPQVVASILASGWFTPEYIQEVVKNEPAPKRKNGVGEFEDPLLAEFLPAFLSLPKEDPQYIALFGILLFLTQRMVGPQGHPFPLNKIEFVDEKLLASLAQYGISPDREVDRGMIFDVRFQLIAMVAPEQIRRKVIRNLCAWGDGYIDRKLDVFAWSQVARVGAVHFITTRWSEK